MSQLRVIVFTFLSAFAGAFSLEAQPGPLWKNIGLKSAEGIPSQLSIEDDGQVRKLSDGISLGGGVRTFRLSAARLQTSVPEVLDAEIKSLASALGNDPERILNYVKNTINHELYQGSRKGAKLTFLEGSGNDLDQCLLLLDLLKAAGYENYALFQVTCGVDIADVGTWLNLAAEPYPGKTFEEVYGHSVQSAGYVSGTSDLLAKQVEFSVRFLNARRTKTFNGSQNAGWYFYQDTGKYYVFMDRFFLINLSNNNLLDPSYKRHEEVSQSVDLSAALEYERQQFLLGVGGVNGGNFTQGLNELFVKNELTEMASNLSDYIENQHFDSNASSILKKHQIIAGSSPGSVLLMNGTSRMWIGEVPSEYRSEAIFSIEGNAYSIFTSDLAGRKVTVNSEGNVVRLRLDDDQVAYSWNNVLGSTFDLKVEISHPFEGNSSHETKKYKKNNSIYSIVYAFGSPSRLLQKRYEQLNRYIDQGMAGDSREVRSELLNIMGLTWMQQTYLINLFLCGRNDVDNLYEHRFGRVAQEEGFYIDVGLQTSALLPLDGLDGKADRVMQVSSLFWSAMEHGVIEQMQPGASAVSTVNILRKANQSGQPIYQARPDNWGAVSGSLINYGGNLAEFGQLISVKNAKLLLPQNANIQQGIWLGSGWIVYADSMAGMIIGGGYGGGYSTNYGAISYPSFITNYVYHPGYSLIPASSPLIDWISNTVSAVVAWGSDPVDMATGAFTYAQTDLETGVADIPMGMLFSRQYSSKDNELDEQHLGFGWTHNLHIRAAKRTATEETLGLSTLQHAVSLITAAMVVEDLYREDASPKEWLTAVLTVAWFQDQMLNNAVSVTIGDKVFQFIKQPDGEFLSPAGSTMSMRIINGGYVLSSRHGNTIYFGYSNKGGADVQLAYFIDDVDGKRMSFGYYSDDRIYRVIDAYNRVYVFEYNGSRISKVTDHSDGRYVEFAYDTHGNLVSSKDPEGKFTYYDYEASGDPSETEAVEHRIVVLRDHDSNVITQNVYDELGRVSEQYLHGDPQKKWKLSYLGSESYEEDPVGGVTTYYYDKSGRLVGKKDANGNRSSWTYDAQDRIVQKASAEGEVLYSHYDSNHNLVRVDLPRGGGSIHYVYDSHNRLISETDAEGNVTQYTYAISGLNLGKNRPWKITDPSGATTTLAYFEGGHARGNLYTSTDARGLVTQYNYDYYAQPVWVLAPGGFLTQYQYSARGDLLLVTDPSGVKTAFTYNKRRQVTQQIGDQGGATQAVTDYTYDNMGNLASETAPPDNNGQRVSTRSEYTPTEKLKASYLSNGAGEYRTAKIDYDGRDWAVKATDAKGRETTSSYFANGTLAQTVAPLDRTSSFTYDKDERLIGSVSPGAPASRHYGHAYQVSASGYPQTVFTDADGQSVTSVFDRNENLRFYTNKKGEVFEMRYDAAGRLTHVITPSGKTHQTSYTPSGEVAQQVEPSGDTATFSYHATTGRPSAVTFASAQGGGGSTVTFDTYDSNGNLLKVSEGGKSVERTYDRQNRVVSCTDSAGNQIGYRYYGSGKLAKRIYPGGTENGLGHVEYTYWATGQLKEVIDRLSSVESPRVTTFYWDEGGSLTRVVRPNGTERQISYDFAGRPDVVREVAADGRLIKLFKNQYFPSDQLQSLYQLPYGKGQQETPLAKSVYGAVGSMEYNADNQLVRFEGEDVVHDLDGNMVYGPLPGGVMSGYSYDSRNRLLSAGGLSYSYDPEGERIGAGGNGDAIHYVNEVNHGLSQVLRRTKNGAETTYVWGIGLLYEVGEDGEAVYYHYDNVGSTIALSNEAGLAIERMEYEPYGTLVHRAREAGFEGGLHDTAYLFAGFYGYQTDSSGLVYLRERYYNPLTRRFINPDPAREGWNWYAYAGGDPMGFVDPSGLGTESVLDAVQTGLSALGMMPIVGAAFDILNAGISFVSGQHVAALMNLASAVPGIGDAFAAGKMALAGAKVAAASFGAGMAAFGKVGGGVKSFRAANNTIRWGPATGAGPLGEGVAATFRGGSYTQMVTQEATTLYRAYGGRAGELGSYWTRTAPAGPLQTRIDSALLPKWGNTAENVSTITVPRGTTIYEGFAAPQGNLMGGGNQIYIPHVNPSWLTK